MDGAGISIPPINICADLRQGWRSGTFGWGIGGEILSTPDLASKNPAAGAQPPEGTWPFESRAGATYYVLHLLAVLPLTRSMERPQLQPVAFTPPSS